MTKTGWGAWLKAVPLVRAVSISASFLLRMAQLDTELHKTLHIKKALPL